jgi:hypothetical protein
MGEGVPPSDRIVTRRAVVALLTAAALLAAAALAATEIATGAGSVRLRVMLNGSGAVSSNDNGINCGAAAADCEQDYNPDNKTTVVLSASPQQGVTFTGWSGDECQPVPGAGSNTCQTVMDQNRDITANFSDGSPTPGPSPSPSATPSPSPSASASPSPQPSASPSPSPPPRYTLKYSKTQDMSEQKGRLELTMRPKKDVTLRLRCRVRIGKHDYKCRSIRRSLHAGTTYDIGLRWTSENYQAIKSALRAGRTLSANVFGTVSAPGATSAEVDRTINLRL